MSAQPRPAPDGPALSPRPPARRGASLRVRLTLLLALVLLPATLLLFYVAFESARSTRRAAEQDQLRLAELVAASQAQRLAEARGLLSIIAQLHEVQAADPAACTARLAGLLPLFPAYGSMAIADAQGNLYCSTIPFTQTVNISQRPWFQAVLATNSFAVGDYVVNRQGNPSLGLGYPVRDAAGRVIGAASLGLN